MVAQFSVHRWLHASGLGRDHIDRFKQGLRVLQHGRLGDVPLGLQPIQVTFRNLGLVGEGVGFGYTNMELRFYVRVPRVFRLVLLGLKVLHEH